MEEIIKRRNGDVKEGNDFLELFLYTTELSSFRHRDMDSRGATRKLRYGLRKSRNGKMFFVNT